MSEQEKAQKAETGKKGKPEAAPEEGKKAEEKKEKKPRLTFKEKFAETTTEEECHELAQKVAELRLDPEAARAPAWKTIREHEDVCLTSDQFHKIIRISPYYKETVLGVLEKQIKEGWVYNGNLDTLTGVDVPQELVDAMEANKESEKAQAKGRGRCSQRSQKSRGEEGLW